MNTCRSDSRFRGFSEGGGTPGGGDRYFTLYETSGDDVLTSASYLERLNNPSPWTTEIVPLVTSRRRTVLRMEASMGQGIGGGLCTLELGPAPEQAGELRAWIRDHALPRAMSGPGIVAAHAGEADEKRSRLGTVEERLMERRDDVARWVILLEGIEPLATLDAAEELRVDLRQHGALPDHSAEVFTLTFMLGPDAMEAAEL